MGKTYNPASTDAELRALKAKVEKLARATPLASASVERGRLRFYAGSQLLIEDGNLTVSGTAEVSGTLTGGGSFTWTGPVVMNGTVKANGDVEITKTLLVGATSTFNNDVSISKKLDVGATSTFTGVATFQNNVSIQKDLDVTAATRLRGLTTLEDDLTILSGGRIKVASMIIDPNIGTYGGISSPNSIFFSTPSIYLDGSFTATGESSFSSNLAVNGALTVGGAKQFRMDHPLKEGHWIQHGSTESPISGTEYTGRGTFDDAGECRVVLPDYFEALNKPENRSIQITPIGRPYMIGTDEINEGAFIVYGEAGRSFYWLVKGERFGGDFEVEPLKEAA